MLQDLKCPTLWKNSQKTDGAKSTTHSAKQFHDKFNLIKHFYKIPRSLIHQIRGAVKKQTTLITGIFFSL